MIRIYGKQGRKCQPDIPRQDSFEPAQRPNPPGSADPVVCIFLLTPPRGASWFMPRWGPRPTKNLVPHNSSGQDGFFPVSLAGFKGTAWGSWNLWLDTAMSLMRRRRLNTNGRPKIVTSTEDIKWHIDVLIDWYLWGWANAL